MSFSFWAAGVAWLLAGAWVVRTTTTLWHLSEVPNLLDPRSGPESAVPGHPPQSETMLPELAVIVPALNEEAAIGTCLRSLLASEGLRLEIIAVDDRSTDATGAVMDSIERAAMGVPSGGHSLRVLHITELPADWLGKPHALALAARQVTAPFLLFTDADAFYAPDALARAMRLVAAERADHLVLLPTPILGSAGERMMMGMIQVLSVWGLRLWKVPDPRARDALGVGCFNLLRREAYEGIGGFEALRLEVVEDLRLGYLVKHHGYRQRVAFGLDLLRLRWGSGALGIVHNLEKNFFALCRYRVVLFAGALGGTAALTLLPLAGLAGPAALRLPSLVSLAAIVTIYVSSGRRTRIPAWYVLSYPLACCLFLYAMLRSAFVTLQQGGVRWRGTFYPLALLRRSAGRLF